MNKNTETEILKTYNSYWENYLKGDVEAMHPLLAEEYSQVGSAEGEVFSNKKDAVQFLYDTIDQVAGHLEMRNRKTTIEQQEKAILIHEFCDLYALDDKKWIFYSKFRASTLMHQKSNGWKITHQHSSFPDSKAEEGQNIAIDKVAEENKQLREAVKRRTIELEHKNRDLEIEAALERVRARTMAMQGSSELIETAEMLYDQLRILGAESLGVAFAICEPNNINVKKWTSIGVFSVPYTAEEGEKHMYEAWKNQADIYEEVYEGEKIRKYYEMFMKIPAFMEGYKNSNQALPTWQKNHAVPFKHGYLLFITTKPFAETNIFIRFAKVFNQTYTRFLDLQKAEAQTREAQINLAVERVRARALAMFKSEEILDLVFKLKQEMMELDIPALVAATIHLKEKDGNYTMWDLTELEYTDGKIHQPMVINYRLDEIDPALFIKKIWKNKEPYCLIVQDNEGIKLTLKFLRDHGRTKEADESEEYIKNNDIKYVYHPAIPLNSGRMCIDLLEPPSNEIEMILTKMGAAFDLAYKRFEDLKNSEVQLREAQIEASLERIRSRAMAMNTSEELSTLIGFIYTEYTKLNMQLDRGFIMTFDTDTKDAHWWMVSAAAPDMPLKILVKYHEYAPYLAILKGWEDREQRWSYVLDGNNKKTWDDYQFANALSQLPNAVKENMRSVKSVILNASFQNFGCIMLSSFEPLSDDHFDLLIRLSKVFELTYIRFLDLQLKEQNAIKLTEEKLKLELTLSELRATQTQLIQSEKLASLGELTAGIAHEIQNPLNFVNNFSEVSNELIQEIKDERKKTKESQDEGLVAEILEDISGNLEKINAHGKRASSIVKGMLEHARTSTSEKELTDINALADEYLRLAYHGFKAKDKSFNADFKTDLDPNLPKIAVIPQDIGRVLLNLINNAFWAVKSVKKPLVEVKTDHTDNQLIIKVTDNGTGMSEATKAKIFQPFFTTKPTGQGTGLGLSLSYDIITKGHSGTIDLESKEGEGTIFLIKLPIN